MAIPPDPNTVSLRDHIERILSELDTKYEQRFRAQEMAGDKALASTKEALTVALDAVNKSNASAMEANKTLAAKAEEFADQKFQTHNSIRPWVQSLIDSQGEKIAALEKRVSRFENREEGMSLTTKVLVGLLSVVATLVTLYFALNR